MASVTSAITADDSIRKANNLVELFGRENELLALKNVYGRVTKTNSFERVIVHGDSGTGKTSLVMSLQESVLIDDGFFCSGKYFQNSELLGQEPYSAIMAAFSDLCDLMLQSSHLDEKRKHMIQETLGSDGKLLLNSVTNISPFLVGDQSDYINTSSSSFDYYSITKFKNACKSFIRAMCSDDYPVVLFLDDIQWMDEGSEGLLEALLQDKQMQNFMLILAYRDNEEVSSRLISTETVNYDLNIQLRNLDSDSVNQMVLSNLGVESNIFPTVISSLCSLVASRTNGNPFHILQFIELLIEDRLIAVDAKSGFWMCDVCAIQESTMMSESFADLLSQKVNSIDKTTQKILRLASLLGYSFKEYIIFEIGAELLVREGFKNGIDETLQKAMEKAIEARFIEKTFLGYKFTHDKLQYAFRNCMEDGEEEKLHLMIGYRLMEKPGDNFSYAAAVHLNCVTGHFTKLMEDRVLLAKMNLKASKYCEGRYAFQDAVKFLKKGISLLGEGEQKWSSNFELAFEMTELLAKLEFTLGNIDACISVNRDILHRSKSKQTKVNALLVEINALFVLEKFDVDMARLGKKILSELGIRVPRFTTPLHVFLKLKKLRRVVDRKSDEDVLALPSIDSELADTVRVITRISWFFFLTKNFLMGFYADLLAAEYTILHGLSQDSANAIFNFGKVEGLVGQKDRGHRLATLAIRLISQRKPQKDDGQVLIVSNYLLLFHRERLQMNNSLLFTVDTLNGQLEDGNVIIAIICGVYSFFLQLFAGDNLEELEISMSAIYERSYLLDQQVICSYYKPMLQFILNMMNTEESCWEELTVLTGEIMNEEEYVRECLPSLHTKQTNVFLICKMMLAYNFGFYEVAESIIDEINFFLSTAKTFVYIPSYFYFSLIYYARYKSTRYRRHLMKARKHQKVLERCHSDGNPNAVPYLRVAEAVELSVKTSDLTKVRGAFDRAIKLLAAAGWIHSEAIANELAGFALRSSDYYFSVSNAYLQRAMDLYLKWGATAKYLQLRKKVV